VEKKMKHASPVEWKNVSIDRNSFWGKKQEINRKITIPLEYKLNKKSGVFNAYKWDWWKDRGKRAPWRIWVGDISKWIEAASYSIALKPDRALSARIDEAVECIVKGQKSDGYIFPNPMMKEQVFSNLQEYHELYEMGHDMEGAVALFQATGKSKFLDAMCKNADMLCRVFGRGKNQKRGYCGHPEIELALIRLYRATGNDKYLKLAKYFIDERGRRPYYFKKEMELLKKKGLPLFGWYKDEKWYWYCQAHKPVRKQDEAAGHAVRLLYLYSAVADAAVIDGDRGLLDAAKRIWNNIVQKRMYVTGGVGSLPDFECFTFDHDLPNETAYAETCAAIALVFFAHRMLQVEVDSQYADVMERALYNGVLSGVGMDGETFFYANPLAVYPKALEKVGSHRAGTRQKWFGCACCPPNIARLLASLGGYVYSVAGNTAYVHLFVSGKTEFSTGDAKLKIVQKTDYPWDGRVEIKVDSTSLSAQTIAVRIPGWCRKAEASVNGKKVSLAGIVRKGYAHFQRKWGKGDKLSLNFPMPVECVEAHPAVRMNTGKIAVQRGPLVYCLEEIDNGKNLADIRLAVNPQFKTTWRKDIDGGYVAIEGRAKRRSTGKWNNKLYSAEKSAEKNIKLIAVPYHLRANRKPGEMRVWIGM